MKLESQNIESQENPLRGSKPKLPRRLAISPSQKYYYEIIIGNEGPYIKKRPLWGMVR